MSETAYLEDLASRMPKAELHLHLEGTLEPELAFHIAERNHVLLRYPSVEAMRAAYDFSDLQSFLDVYYAATSALVDEQDFYDLTWAYVERAAINNVRHIEPFFDPQAHMARGVPFGIAIQGILHALEDAEESLGMTWRLIMCFLRDLPAEEAMSVLRTARLYRQRLAGVGLDSAEIDNPPSKFADVFAEARALGLHVVAHAGEEGPPAYIAEALDVLRVERIEHGVRCMEDPALVQRLKVEGIPLTVCPLSNVKLRVVERIKDHPLKRMLDAGLNVTVNSDDPAYFGGYVNANYIAAVRALGLTREDLHALARNSFAASFLDSDTKDAYLTDVDAFFAEN